MSQTTKDGGGLRQARTRRARTTYDPEGSGTVWVKFQITEAQAAAIQTRSLGLTVHQTARARLLRRRSVGAAGKKTANSLVLRYREVRATLNEALHAVPQEATAAQAAIIKARRLLLEQEPDLRRVIEELL